MKRCFIAVDLPDETRTRLVRLQQGLRRLPRAAARRLRISPTTNLHVTVQFLGATPEDQVDAIVAALRAVACRHPPITATLSGVGAFPNPDRPRVLFAAVGAGHQGLVTLARDVEHACAALGFPGEDRPYEPHVTLAKAEAPRASGPLTDWLTAHGDEALGPVDGRTLTLYESALGPQGSIYTALARLSLGEP